MIYVYRSSSNDGQVEMMRILSVECRLKAREDRDIYSTKRSPDRASREQLFSCRKEDSVTKELGPPVLVPGCDNGTIRSDKGYPCPEAI